MTVSPDSATWDKNLYAYCDNNPVGRKDDGGRLWVQMLGGAAYGLATQFVADLAYSLYSGQKLADVVDFGTYASAMVSGMVGAVAGPVLSNLVDVFVAPAIEQVVNMEAFGDSWDTGEYFNSVGEAALTSTLSCSIQVDIPTGMKDVYSDAYHFGARGKKEINAFYHVKKAVSSAWNFISDAAISFFSGR